MRALSSECDRFEQRAHHPGKSRLEVGHALVWYTCIFNLLLFFDYAHRAQQRGLIPGAAVGNFQMRVFRPAFDPDLRPKGALLRLLSGTPASGGHPDSAAGQTPVFGRAATA
jgi:hypothetical protein